MALAATRPFLFSFFPWVGDRSSGQEVGLVALRKQSREAVLPELLEETEEEDEASCADNKGMEKGSMALA
jgi:hypothetical protein